MLEHYLVVLRALSVYSGRKFYFLLQVHNFFFLNVSSVDTETFKFLKRHLQSLGENLSGKHGL